MTAINAINGNVGDECAVCLEEYKANEKLVRLACNHVFHHHCFNNANQCPLDRKEITKIEDYDVPAPPQKSDPQPAQPLPVIADKPVSIDEDKFTPQKIPPEPKKPQLSGSALYWALKMGHKV